jgi:hypothetical protein
MYRMVIPLVSDPPFPSNPPDLQTLRFYFNPELPIYLNSETREKLQSGEWLISASPPEFSHLRAPSWRHEPNGIEYEFQGDSMATPIQRADRAVAQDKELIGYDEAMEKLSREERFRATVYSMNTLLVQKGVYSPQEFEFQFRQFAQKNLR